MTPARLRNYIPIGAPARREPADGLESSMRVSLGFEPAWYSIRCGTDFGERWHRDPLFRYASIGAMKEELLRSFPDAGLWDRERIDDRATVSGCYGAYPVPLLFGMSLRYFPDRWPEPEPSTRLSRETIRTLDPDRLLAGPLTEEIAGQMDLIEREWGIIGGYLNWQGVLNNAFTLRGQDIFLDMHDDPPFAHDFFDLITDVMIRFASTVQARQRRSGFFVNQFSVSNCVMNMISPQTYREFHPPPGHPYRRFLRPVRGAYLQLGHHPIYRCLGALPKVGYLDMGMMSDLPRIRASVPGCPQGRHLFTLDAA